MCASVPVLLDLEAAYDDLREIDAWTYYRTCDYRYFEFVEIRKPPMFLAEQVAFLYN